MEIFVVALILVAAIYITVNYFRRQFKEGETCHDCGSRGSGCSDNKSGKKARVS